MGIWSWAAELVARLAQNGQETSVLLNPCSGPKRWGGGLGNTQDVWSFSLAVPEGRA